MVEKALIDSIAMSPEGVAGAQDYDLALRSLRKGYGSLGLPAAGEGAVERVLTLVEVAFMNKHGGAA